MRQVLRVLAMVWVVALGLPAKAHEINPTIADLTVADGRADLVLRLNLESFLAGMDLDVTEDTLEAEVGAEEYEALRALGPDALAERFNEGFDQSLGALVLLADNSRVPLRLGAVEIEDTASVELPRTSVIGLSGEVPEGTRAVSLEWGKGYGLLILRQQGVEDPYTGTLNGGERSPAISVLGGDQLSGWQSFLAYIPVGFDHILPKGLDHILFVLGLFFLSLRMGPLLWQVSAFTLAHTVTLALGALGWVVVPASIVEPLIAASITYVAVENILSKGLTRWRPVVVFLFGLLHGLGVASVLGDFGLPEGTFVAALLGFNVGVELGQLCVIALAFLAVGLWFGQKTWYRARIAVPASCGIALIGAYWCVERVFF
jgi:hypothetical protein